MDILCATQETRINPFDPLGNDSIESLYGERKVKE